ncbi:MAG: hypothetical protein ACRDKG_00510, partial [Actinomycetota bacterium]
MNRLRTRLATVAPLFLLAGCTEQEISDGIEDAILSFLGAIGKVILISLGLLLAFSAVLFIGMASIALGLRRKKVDVGALALFVLGGGVILSAWPLIFSQSGLAGVWAPGSTGGVSAEPVAGQAIAAVAGIVIAVVAVRRYRRKEAAKQRGVAATTPAPPAPAVPLPIPPPPPPATAKEPTKASTKPKPRNRPKAG